jgi:hypothetical protein
MVLLSPLLVMELLPITSPSWCWLTQLELWDTHGAERFQAAMSPMYYRHARGVVLVYDITDR